MSFFEKMANKMAEKAFSDPKFQQSWQVHLKAFGPPLSPAFEGNAPAKVHLTAALNCISRGDCKAGRSLIAPFWRWFAEAEQRLIDMLRAKEHDALLALLTEKLSPLFPFMKRDLEFGLMFNDDLTQFEMEMADFYVTALHEGYRELLAACPEALKSRWTFKIIH